MSNQIKLQELFLYGQVEDSKHSEILSILSGLAASEPRPLYERHVMFKPAKVGNVDTFVGGSQMINTRPRTAPQNKDNFYVQLVKVIPLSDFGKDVAEEAAQKDWRRYLYATPEPNLNNQRQAGLRAVQISEVEAGNPIHNTTTAGYLYMTQFVSEGHELVMDGTILYLHRIRRFVSEPPPPSINGALPAIDGMPLLDASGTWMLRATVNVADGTPKLISQGLAEIESTKKRLKGTVDLVIPDRLSMDTRAR